MKPDAPEPPSPIATSMAQTGTNVSTAIANQQLNQTNQVTPEGSLTYSQSGTYDFTDPTTGQVYTLPKSTMTQELSEQNKQIKAQQDATKYKLAEMANSQATRISDVLSSPFDPNSTAPQAGNAQNIANIGQARTSFDTGGSIQKQLADSGAITRDYGPADGFSADRQRAEDAIMGRINPQLQQEQARIRQQLADQGIRYGSKAYSEAFDPYNRQANDARFAAVAAGGQEQSRLTGLAAQRAAFQNEAQNQQYAQNLGAGSFANAAQGQQFSQNAQGAAFENAGLAQQLAQQQSAFNAANAQRGQYMNEAYAQRNQPLNEINSLQSQSQISNPNFVNAPSTQIPTTDVAGLINQNFAQQQQNYQQQNANWQSLVGGVSGAAAGYLRSDRRSKENIHKLGTIFAAGDDDHAPMGSVIADREKLPIYQYSYKDDPSSVRHIGPMAQDVEKIDPKAVKEFDGVKHIDKRRLMGGILRAA